MSDEKRGLSAIQAENDAAVAAGETAESPENLAAAENWPKRSWDDHGNAERLIQHSKGRLKWVTDTEEWVIYDQNRWIANKDAAHSAAMQMVNIVLPLEANQYSNEKDEDGKSERGKFKTWAATQRSVSAHRNTAQALRFTRAANITSLDFDADPMLFNAANGVINLSTGEMVAHDPILMMRSQSSVIYDPSATSRRWTAFLERVMPDPEMRGYLQRIVGYSMTASTAEQVMFIHNGETANGKSVFLQVMEAALGSYSQVVPPTTLVATRDDKHPTDINRMQGKRMLQLSETARGARLDEALIKRLTGQETVTARGMGKDFHDFRIVGKIHMVTNHLPHISASDPAVLRRVRVLNWSVTIPPDERDIYLTDKIKNDDLQAVLAWAVQGAIAWRQHGLQAPAASIAATEAYFRGEDELGLWLEERTMPCAFENPWDTTQRLYEDYAGWCFSSGIKAMSKIAFSRDLGQRGIEQFRKNSRRGWALAIASTESSGLPDPLA